MECEEHRTASAVGVGDENAVDANNMQQQHEQHQPVVAVPPARSATPAPSSHSSGIPSVPRVPSSSSLSTLTGGGTSTAAAANNGGNANNANATTAGGGKKKKKGGSKQHIQQQQQQQYQSPLPPPPPTHNSGNNLQQGHYVSNGKGGALPPPPPPSFPPGSNAPPPNNDTGGVTTIDGEMQQQLGPPPDVYAMPIRKRSVSTHSASERGVAGLIEDLAKIDQEEQEKELKRQAKEQKRAQKALLKQQQRQEQQNHLQQRQTASTSTHAPQAGGTWQHPHGQDGIINHTPPTSYGDDFHQHSQQAPQQKQQEVQQQQQPPLGFAMERFLSNAPGAPKQTQLNNSATGATDKLADGSILPPPPIPQNNSYVLVNTSDPRSGGLPVAFGSGKGDQDESDASSLLSDLIAEEDGECGSVQLGDVVIHPVTRTGSFRANKSQQSTGMSGQNEHQEQFHLQPPLPPTANAPGSMNNSVPVAGGNPNADALSRDRAQSFASAVTSHSDFGDTNEGVGGAVAQPSPQRPPSNPRPKNKNAGAGAGKASKKNRRDSKKKSNNGGNAEIGGGAKTEKVGRKSPSAHVIMVDDFDYDKYAPAPPPAPLPHQPAPQQEQVGPANTHSAVQEKPQERPLQDVDHSFHHYYQHMPPYHHEAQQGQQQQMGAPSFQPQQHPQPAYAPVVNHSAVSPSSHHHHSQPPVYGSTGEVDGSFQRQQGYGQEGAYQNFHPHPPMQHFQYSPVPQHQPVGEANSRNMHPGGANVVTGPPGADDPDSLVPLVVHTNNAGGTVVNNRGAPTMFSQSTTSGSQQISAAKSRSNPQHLRHSLLRVESFASAVESVFSSVRSVSTADLEADMNDSEKYLASGMLSRAFPERFFALIVTLAVEIPVLLMISGGSDRLCGILGRKRYQLLMAFLPLSSAISGNCGLQASTLTTRAISHLHVTKGSYFKWLFKEMGASLFLGLGMGIVLGFVAFQASGNDIVFGATIFVGNVLSILTAGFTGTMAPLIFTFIFHRDSGKWGGPLETAIQDIVGSFAMVILSYRLLLWFGPSAVDPSDYCGAQEAI